MARKNDNLFQRLTHLFRSGPVVKRKVKAYKQGNASTANDVFKKTLSHVYNTAMSAYGTYDRMARYSDYCFEGDTLVYTTKGVFTIRELAEDKVLGERFHVYSYDYDKKQIVIGTAMNPRVACGGVPQDLVRVHLDDGGHLDVTPDHKMILRSGEVVEAQDLTPNTSMMPFYVRDLMGNGYKWVHTMDSRAKNGWIPEHQVVVEHHLGRALYDNEEVHHIDFDPGNNMVENLKSWDRTEHRRYHTRLNNRNKLGKPCRKHSQGMIEDNPTKRQDITYDLILDTASSVDFKFKEVSRLLGADYNVIKRRVRSRGFTNWQDFAKRRTEAIHDRNHEVIVKETRGVEYDDIVKNFKKDDTLYSLSSRLDCTSRSIQRRLMSHGYDNWSDFRASQGVGRGYQGKRKGPKPDSSFTYQDVCDNYLPGMTLRELGASCGTTHNKVLSRIRNESGVRNYSEWVSAHRNHKIVRIEYLTEKKIVYNVTVEKFHNLAVGSLNPSTSTSDRKYSMLCVCQSEMEYTPEIASALDIYSEEAASADERGQTLHVYSENRQIKQILSDLFYDTLNVEFNLTPWVRDLVKYGDVFLFNDVSTQYGVQNVFTIPVNELEREEGFDPNDPLAVRFRWVTQGNQVLENWQITHMRLLGNDAFLPYGSSVLESARRIWRQLILIEDAMLVYRVVRSPERRVFYIDVGNVPPEDVSTYMEQAKSILRSNQVVDQTTGRVDLRYNPLSVDEDYFIPIRGSETGTKIDTLAGGTNVTAIEDVEYIQKKLFSALNVPKAYLGYDEALSSKATLSQEDIRFSRKIHRIQKVVLSELNKLAIIHLFCHGYEGEDLLDFELKLSNPSTIAQQQKLELFRMRFDIAAAAPEGIVDRYWIRKNIMGLTDDEIERIEDGRMEDKRIDQEIEASAVPGEEGAGGGGSGGGSFGGGGGDFGDLDLDLEDEGGEAEADESGEDTASDEDEELDLDLSTQLVGGSLLSSLGEVDGDFVPSGSPPVKPSNRVSRTKQNRKKLAPHGRGPSIDPGLEDNSVSDPFDKKQMLGAPVKRDEVSGILSTGIDPIERFLSDGVKIHARLDGQLQTTLKSLSKEIGKTSMQSLISEVSKSDDLLDLEIDDGESGENQNG